MKAITVSTMKSLEEIAINEYGIPSIVLMENAAMGFVAALKCECGPFCAKKILVVCGKGNNAGDGFAIARLLHFGGAKVSVLPLFDIDSLTPDAKVNAQALKNMSIPFIKEINDEYDIIIDAIFGTGFRGNVDSPVKEIIEKVNESNSFVASVDVPSGASLGEFSKNLYIVNADLCVTFGYAKLNQFVGLNRNSFKRLAVVPISVPQPDDSYKLITKDTFHQLPNRLQDSHKGTFGKVLAVTGSLGMAGASVLSGGAVLKSGAGMLTIATPEENIPVIAHEIPSAMTLPLAFEGGELTDAAIDVALEKAKTMDAVLIGCGIGVNNGTKKLVKRFANECKVPMIIDADGLNILSEEKAIPKGAILTPHIAEFSRLSGKTIEEIKENPIEEIVEFSNKFGVTVILKDAVSIICDDTGKLAVCHAPNSGMATAGSGDVLAGIIASMVAQGMSSFDAACCGVYVHSAAGALAKDALGEAGMTAADILSFVPKAQISSVDIAPHIKEL